MRTLRVLSVTLVAAAFLATLGYVMRDALLRGLLYFPMRPSGATPAWAGLEFEDLTFRTEDGVDLHGWWIPAGQRRAGRAAVHLLLCHGNAGSIEDRLIHARYLVDQLNAILAAVSLVEWSLVGTDTRPKEIVADPRECAAMGVPPLGCGGLQ